jgi:hypothetical protein
MSEKPISPLRQRMIEDMSLGNFGEKTRNDYIRNVKTFTAFLVARPIQQCLRIATISQPATFTGKNLHEGNQIADAAVILTSRSKQFSVSTRSRYQSSRISSPLCGLTIIERLIAPGLLSVLFLPRVTH